MNETRLMVLMVAILLGFVGFLIQGVVFLNSEGKTYDSGKAVGSAITCLVIWMFFILFRELP